MIDAFAGCPIRTELTNQGSGYFIRIFLCRITDIHHQSRRFIPNFEKPRIQRELSALVFRRDSQFLSVNGFPNQIRIHPKEPVLRFRLIHLLYQFRNPVETQPGRTSVARLSGCLIGTEFCFYPSACRHHIGCGPPFAPKEPGLRHLNPKNHGPQFILNGREIAVGGKTTFRNFFRVRIGFNISPLPVFLRLPQNQLDACRKSGFFF